MEINGLFALSLCACISLVVCDIDQLEQPIDDGSCRDGDCGAITNDAGFRHKNNKYLMDKEPTLKPRVPDAMLYEIGRDHVTAGLDIVEAHDEDMSYDVGESVEVFEEQTHEHVFSTGEASAGDYQYPKLVRINPGQVGDEVELELQDGKFYKRITKSVNPPVFVIPDFLSAEECNRIIDAARSNGLTMSNLFGSDVRDEIAQERNGSDITRISDQTWLTDKDVGTDFWSSLKTRLTRLTGLDVGIIERSEPIQVVSYMPGGHYHAHLDSGDANDLPCCFQTHCGEKENTPAWTECCRKCRYITVLYYLNDVEEGGETAFPLADMKKELQNEKLRNIAHDNWYNLSLYCQNASLVVSPKRGTAVFWYSHHIDEETGYLGPIDKLSHHGGCDLIKGNKWIANNWITAPTYKDRFKQSLFYMP